MSNIDHEEEEEEDYMEEADGMMSMDSDDDDFDDDEEDEEDEEQDLLATDDKGLLEFLEENPEAIMHSVTSDDALLLSRLHSMFMETQMYDTEDAKETAETLHRLVTQAETDDGRCALALAASSSEPWAEFLLQFYEQPFPDPGPDDLLCEAKRNPLHYAAMSNEDNASVVDLLSSSLPGGMAMLVQEDEEGNSPVYYAARYANVNCMKEILGAVQDEMQEEEVLSVIISRNAEGLSALHSAVFSGCVESFQVLADWLLLCATAMADSSSSADGDEVAPEEQLKTYLADAKDGRNRTLLHAAASTRNVDMTEVLLSLGLDLFAVDKERLGVVHWAVRGADMSNATAEYVSYLGDLGVDLTSKDCKNRTALHFAAYYGHRQVCEILIETALLSVMAVDRQGWNSLHYAAASGSPALSSLLTMGDDANPASTKNRKRMTPLHVAVCKAQPVAFQQMMDFTSAEQIRCYYNAVDYRGRTYLFYCSLNNLEMGAQLLLQSARTSNDVGLHSLDSTGKNVMHAAAMSGALRVAQLVQETFGEEEAHKLLRAADKRGRTVLHLAAARGHSDFIDWVVGEGLGELNQAKDKAGNLPLHYAARFGEMGCFFDLLGDAELQETVERIMATNNDGQTVLHAAAAGDMIMLEYLLEVVGSVEDEAERRRVLGSTDRHGMSALMVACSNGIWNAVDTLLGSCNGFSLSEEDVHGRGLLHLAAMSKNAGMLAKLLSKEEEGRRLALEARAADGTTPLHFAAHHGNASAVRWLLYEQAAAGDSQKEGSDDGEVAGIDVNATDCDGRSALHYAALANHLDCVRLLCEHPRCDPLLKDLRGRTAIDAAAFAGSVQAIDFLMDAVGREAAAALADSEGRHPLHVAVSQGHLEVCEVLLENHDVPATLADARGRTALHRAVTISPELVQMLLERQADVNAQDWKGRTPLMYSAPGFDEDIIQLLLEDGGADPDLKDHKGRGFDHYLPADMEDEEDEEDEPDDDDDDDDDQ